MKYLLDTDWVIDALTGQQSAIRPLQGMALDGIAVSMLTLGEVFEGAISIGQESRLANARAFFAGFTVLNLSEPIMLRFAQERCRLRQTGLMIPDMDLLIGTTALHHGLILVSRNRRHFGRIEGLALYQAAPT